MLNKKLQRYEIDFSGSLVLEEEGDLVLYEDVKEMDCLKNLNWDKLDKYIKTLCRVIGTLEDKEDSYELGGILEVVEAMAKENKGK